MAERKTSVLVVDDQRSMRLTLSAILEDWGCDVTSAEDGYGAIDAAREGTFDLILMDIKMPGINGVQAFREIKKIRPASMVVMMTGYAVEDLVQAAEEEGALSVIYKPFDMEVVYKLIDSLSKPALVLLVEDNTLERESLSEILINRGHRVTSAIDGEEAIELCRDSTFDLIIMDLKLPGKDGYATFQAIRATEPGTSVLFVTGGEIEDPAKAAAEFGGYTILNKPLDMPNLLMLVQRTGVVKPG